MIRIVKMTFAPEKVATFLQNFHASKSDIRSFKGCLHLELLQDQHTPNIFFTYSFWESEDHLNHYRESPLFKAIWSKTKILFIAKPEAWSVERQVMLD